MNVLNQKDMSKLSTSTPEAIPEPWAAPTREILKWKGKEHFATNRGIDDSSPVSSFARNHYGSSSYSHSLSVCLERSNDGCTLH